MNRDANEPDFRAVEAVEARSWASLPGVTATQPLFDSRGLLAGNALFSDSKLPLLNRVVGLGTDRTVEPETLDRIIEAYDAALAETTFIPLAPVARPSTLPRMLKERGFEPGMKEAKLCRSTKDPPEQDAYFRIRRAAPDELEALLYLYTGAGMQKPWAEVMAANLGAPGWHHFVALDSGKPVALASMFVSGKYALCFPGWSLPAYRKRGYQRALGVHRIVAAGELGCDWVTTNVDVTDGPIGFTVRSYTRLGFELLYVRTTYIRHRPNVPLPNAYTRRLLLPYG